MKKKFLFFPAVLIASLFLCGCWPFVSVPPTDLPTDQRDQVELGNPAAIKCADDGGTIETYKEEEGEWGLCVFEDGSICDQWQYYRGECKKGECQKECLYQGTDSEGYYNNCTMQRLELVKCGQGSRMPAILRGVGPGPYVNQKCIDDGGTRELYWNQLEHQYYRLNLS